MVRQSPGGARGKKRLKKAKLTSAQLENKLTHALSAWNNACDTALQPIPLPDQAPTAKSSSIGAVRIWDYDKFLQRLSTYTAWFGKPRELNKVECASRGWINSSRNELSCETCKASLKHEGLAMHSKEQTKAFAEKLNTGHAKYCVWDDVDPNTVVYLMEKYEKDQRKRKPSEAVEGEGEQAKDTFSQVQAHLDNALGI